MNAYGEKNLILNDRISQWLANEVLNTNRTKWQFYSCLAVSKINLTE